MAKSSTPSSPADVIRPDTSRDYRRDVLHYLVDEPDAANLVDKYIKYVPQEVFYDFMEASGSTSRDVAIQVVYWLYHHFAGATLIAGVMCGSFVITGYSSDVWLPVVSKRSAVDLRSMPYQEFLKTDHWRRVRADALERADHCCQLCAGADRLEVHHRSYDRRGNERDSDVIVLCRSCHAKFHGIEP